MLSLEEPSKVGTLPLEQCLDEKPVHGDLLNNTLEDSAVDVVKEVIYGEL